MGTLFFFLLGIVVAVGLYVWVKNHPAVQFSKLAVQTWWDSFKAKFKQ